MWSSFVSSAPVCWILYQDSRQWQVRPSELLHVSDEYVGYCLDQAVGFFGMKVESALDEAESNVSHKKSGRSRATAVRNARSQVLQRYGITTEGQEPRRQYADPAAMM